MSTAEVPQFRPKTLPVGEFSASESVNILNLIRDEDWKGNSEYIDGVLGTRRIGEDLVAIRLERVGSTVLIVGDWDGTEDFARGWRRVRQDGRRLPVSMFIEADADKNFGLLADLRAIQNIRTK